jgi:[histone H4]-N-methyl-L-lysine20 N-methyltransferase
MHVIVEKNPAKAQEKILGISGVRKFHDKLRSDGEKTHFLQHLKKYILMYMPDCPWEVSTTNRYTIDTHEAAVFARREIRKGEVIKYLTGIQVAMSKEEERELGMNSRDFSIVLSSRKKTPSLFLGPARFANHDCDANAELSTTGRDGMQVIARRDIEVDEEITVTYGMDYFGEDNCECLCATCEKLVRNGWAPQKEEDEEEEEQSTQTQTSSTPEVEETKTYSFRRQRKYGSPSTNSSRTATPNTTPQQRNPRKRKSNVAIEAEDAEVSAPSTPVRRVRQKTLHRTSSLANELFVDSETKMKYTYSSRRRSYGSSTRLTKTFVNNSSDDSDADIRRSFSPVSSTFSSQHSFVSTAATSADEDVLLVKTETRKTQSSPLRKAVSTAVINITEDVDIVKAPILSPRTRRSIAARDDSESDLTDIENFKVDEKKKEATLTGKNGHIRKRVRNRFSITASTTLPQPDEPVQSKETSAIEITVTASTEESEEEGGVDQRKPGDYTLTPLLLAHKYSRWVQCGTCDADFVQADAYLTRKECPRCERHSKLYGYAWPKTDKEGKHDPEERILDHRIVHRFVSFEDEKDLKKGRGRSVREELKKRLKSAEAERLRSESEEAMSPGRKGLRKKRSFRVSMAV